MRLQSWERYCLAIMYLISITILFFLPGSVLPKNDWMSKIWFDKWVHIGLFFLLNWLFCWAWQFTYSQQLILLLISAALYGILIEGFQDQFIANRDFDWGDWVADIIGSVAGILVWVRRKKINPCRNRGRNQN
ncbi:MAG: VanZ family protein [Chitinophagaceae bacterium]|nr:VanZ family protein [Chitinophagaceae bacterium]